MFPGRCFRAAILCGGLFPGRELSISAKFLKPSTEFHIPVAVFQVESVWQAVCFQQMKD
jgi:hypothetical protein